VTDVSPPQGLDHSCLMCLVMSDSSITICAESSDDMRYESHVAAVKCSDFLLLQLFVNLESTDELV